MIHIKNGHVIDPLNQINRVTNVIINGDTIDSVGDSFTPCDNVIDASGCYVVPGLIDHHCHMYPLAHIGLPAEAVCFSSGVTTAVDAGSSGCDTFPHHFPFIRDSKLSIYAYLNVCSTGLDSLPAQTENINPEQYDIGKIKDCLQRWPQRILGLKLRTSSNIVKELGFTPLKSTIELAEKLGVSVMVHVTDPPGDMRELISYLRNGDVLTHMYMNIGSTLIENDTVLSEAHIAREHGVIFEAADARAHFGLPVAKSAIRQGFLPDILATDLTKLSMYLRPTAFNLPMQLSKYHALGISLNQLIDMCTVTPARHMGILDHAGSLTPAHPADVTVLRPVNQTIPSGDRPNGIAEQHLMNIDCLFQPVLTIKNGDMVYRDITF